MPRVNKTKYAILGLLTLGPKSGYDIRKESIHGIGYFWNESYGSIYPILRKLEEDGLVTAQFDTEKGIHDRYIYTITTKGYEDFRKWLKRPPDPVILREELLLKVFFGNNIPREDLVKHIRECKRNNEEKLRELDELERWLSSNKPDDRDLPLWLITIDMGRHRATAYISWCNKTIKTLSNSVYTE